MLEKIEIFILIINYVNIIVIGFEENLVKLSIDHFIAPIEFLFFQIILFSLLFFVFKGPAAPLPLAGYTQVFG